MWTFLGILVLQTLSGIKFINSKHIQYKDCISNNTILFWLPLLKYIIVVSANPVVIELWY